MCSLLLLTALSLVVGSEGRSLFQDDFHLHRVISRRGAVKRLKLLWPSIIGYDYKVSKVVIPYSVKKGFWWLGLGSSDEMKIQDAMSIFEKHTCIRFVSRNKQRDFVEFFKDENNVCESSIGRVGGKQTIALGSGCRSPGHITHEIMHTLGFYHEHTRPDRDNYVRILWDNIKPGNEGQFEIRTSSEQTSLGQPYDFRSIMHYHRQEFSQNGKDTIESLQDPSMELGSLSSLSAIDIIQINRLYRCPQAAKQVLNFHLKVYTGTQSFAGTNAKVFIELYGRIGKKEIGSGEVQLLAKEGHFETGGVDNFNVVAPQLGLLTKMTVRHNNQGIGAAWYLEKITVVDDKLAKIYHFRCSCWIQGQNNTKTLNPI